MWGQVQGWGWDGMKNEVIKGGVFRGVGSEGCTIMMIMGTPLFGVWALIKNDPTYKKKETKHQKGGDHNHNHYGFVAFGHGSPPNPPP